MTRVLLLAAVAAILAGCGSSGAATSDWSGPPPAQNGKVPVKEFNDFLDGDGKDFAGSPVAAVAKFLSLDKSTASVTTVRATSPGEVRNYSEVVATEDGLLDDSVRATRYTVELHRDQDNGWRLRAADWAQRCRPGRGHQDFAPQPCV